MQPKNSRRGLTLSRRRFLTLAGLGTGAGLAACAPLATATPVPVSSLQPPTAMVMAATPAPGGPDDMDSMHKAGVETFVAGAGKDDTFWRKPMAPSSNGYGTRPSCHPTPKRCAAPRRDW